MQICGLAKKDFSGGEERFQLGVAQSGEKFDAGGKTNSVMLNRRIIFPLLLPLLAAAILLAGLARHRKSLPDEPTADSPAQLAPPPLRLVRQTPNTSAHSEIQQVSLPNGVISPLPANATSIPDSYLVKLSSMVQLDTATIHQPDKESWQKAINAAERLKQGPCDCEQRNWLVHFIETGHYALADDETNYRESAKLLATLGRNDEQAMAMSQHR